MAAIEALPARAASALVLVALLYSAAIPIFDSDLAAWRHDHGHLSLAGLLTDHDHPWDQRPAQSQPEESDLVFLIGGATVAPDGGVYVSGGAAIQPATGSPQQRTSSHPFHPSEALADRPTPPPRA